MTFKTKQKTASKPRL